MTLVEQATVEELGETYDIQMRSYPRNGGHWTIRVATADPYDGFYVWAEHAETGAVVPCEAVDGGGWGPSKDHRKTLAQARDRAGQLATVLRGTKDTFDWRKEATIHP
jgi:hypothetical protein